MDITEIVSKGMDLINSAKDLDRWRAVVNTVMNLRVLENENFLRTDELLASENVLCSVELRET